MRQSITATLSLTDLFDNFSETQLELVASICEAVTYDKGYILIEEQEFSDDLYAIGRGGLEVLMNPGFVGTGEEDKNSKLVVLTELRQGQIVGEVALVDQGVRSATVRVSENETHLLRIPRSKLMMLCDTYPELGYKLMQNLAADLALKIRNTDLTVRQYQLMLQRSENIESN